jgi:hypothetical protein
VTLPCRRWTTALNVDILALTSHQNTAVLQSSGSVPYTSPYGEQRHYWKVAAIWAAVPLALLVVPAVAVALSRAFCVTRLRRIRVAFWDAALALAIVLHTPVCVALVRMFGACLLRVVRSLSRSLCLYVSLVFTRSYTHTQTHARSLARTHARSHAYTLLQWAPAHVVAGDCVLRGILAVCETRPDGTRRLTVDPTFECLGDSHVAVGIAVAPSFLGMLLGLPLWLARHNLSCVVTSSTVKHER